MDANIKLDARLEIEEEIANLRDLLDKYGMHLIFSRESEGVFLFPDNYRVCANDDPDMEDVGEEQIAAASDGFLTELGNLIQFYDAEYQSIIKE